MKVLILMCIYMCPLKAKIFKKCEFAKIARENGLNNVDKWTCIAYHESHLNSESKNGGFYGILQISGEYWCGPLGKCGVLCQSLLDSDLSDDFRCAELIHSYSERIQGRNGFSQWSSSLSCKGDQQHWLKDCDI